MAALALMTAACSNDDNEFAQQPQKTEGITITAQLAPKTSGATTRAVSEGTNKIVSEWAENEHIAVLYEVSSTKYAADATITAVDGSGTATITFTVEAGTANNTPCTLVYPYTAAKDDHSGVKDAATLLAAQDGTLSSNLDVRVGAGTIQTTTPGLTVTTQPEAQYSIFKFTTKNDAGSSLINVKLLSITIGSQDYDITPASATSELYVALPAISGQDVSFFASSGTGSSIQNYTCSKAGVTFAAGKYYQSTLKMPKVVPTNVAFIYNNRRNYLELKNSINYFRCELYNPWASGSFAIDPANIQMKNYRKVNVTFTLTGFTFTNTAKMVLCCNRGSEQSWEPGCFNYSRAISVNSDGTYTVSWVNDTGSTVNWNDGDNNPYVSTSALTMTMQYDGYASLSNTTEAGLKDACVITSITID